MGRNAILVHICIFFTTTWEFVMGINAGVREGCAKSEAQNNAHGAPILSRRGTDHVYWGHTRVISRLTFRTSFAHAGVCTHYEFPRNRKKTYKYVLTSRRASCPNICNPIFTPILRARWRLYPLRIPTLSLKYIQMCTKIASRLMSE